jgi:hypothetical protein
MSFNRNAWQRARQEGIAPKYQFHGIAGAYTEFAGALLSHSPFMNNYVRGYVEEMMRPENLRDLKPSWIKFCTDIAEQQAIRYEERTQDYDGAYDRNEQIIDSLVRDTGELREWIRTRILESKKDLDQEIRDKVAENDDDARNWRRWHWPEGIYSRGHSYVIPADHIKGFCPKCHEALSERDVWPDRRKDTWMMRCTACREAGSIDEIEHRHQQPFHMVPFTDLALQDWLIGIEQLRDNAPASATQVTVGAR